MFGILGSGFGLYGHLPAIAALSDEPICMPVRYRTTFETRPELADLAPRIVWVEDPLEVIARAHTVTLALMPQAQTQWMTTCLASANVKRLVLEKPLAPSPEVAILLLEQLRRAGKRHRINYSFLFAPWFVWLERQLATPRTLQKARVVIRWTFHAHHFKHNLENWKRNPEAGGGALRFYGIHLIAALSALGANQALRCETRGASSTDNEAWSGTLAHGEVQFELTVDSRAAEEAFTIEIESGVEPTRALHLSNPFAEFARPQNGRDQRIEILVALYRSLEQEANDEPCDALYQATNNLWLAAEHAQ
jgi:predicted dehydrogenase